MPRTTVRVFRDSSGNVPLVVWRSKLRKKNKRAYAKCLERIKRLEIDGTALSQPLAAYLRDGIYELRARSGKEQHRILYFFAGENMAVLSNGVQKESKVAAADIDSAVIHKKLVLKSRNKFSVSLKEWVEIG